MPVKPKKAKPERNPVKKKYSPGAQEKVEEAMHKMKRGQLTSGVSGKLVEDPKQAVAIGLSEARRAGSKGKNR
jgi:Family of unknown function (DUF6496)